MVRTVDSPRCRAPSSPRRLPPFLVSIAFRMAGRCPSNCTSTTAPMTWVMCPVWFAAAAIKLSPSNSVWKSVSPSREWLQCLGAGDDLDQLLGDLGLTGSVVNQGLLADHVAGVAGSVVHRAHLRAVERGVVFQERAEDLYREIARQQARQDLVFFRLVFVGRRRTGVGGRGFHHQRNDLLRGRDLGDDGPEARIEQRADVEFAGIETRQNLVGDIFGIAEAYVAHCAEVETLND